MMTYLKIAVITFIFPLLSSCYQDIIDLDLKETEPQIVIEGYLNDQSSTPMVIISTTGVYDQEPQFIPKSNAQVQIEDDFGQSAVFSEIQPGIYRAENFLGRAGRTYTLIVNADGKQYKATSTMPHPIELDHFTFQYVGIPRYLYCSFHDPLGQEDFCRMKIYRDDLFQTRYLYQGRYSDGEEIILDDFEIEYYPGQTARLELMTIDKNVYQYFAMLNEIDTDENGDDGDDYNPEMPEFFPVTYFNPRSNISNNALGYFSAYSLKTYTLVYY